MPRMFRAICGDLFSQPASRRYPFKDIKESLADYRCRVYFDNKRCDLCDGYAGLCSAAATEVSLGNRQIVSPPLDIFIVVHAYKPAFQTDAFGGEVSAG